MLSTLRMAAVLALLALAGCSAPRPADPLPPDGSASFPGFDTWRYPGDAAMATWREASPYRWVGYYLPSPCHRDPSWAGRRATLERMGWGVAVIYVGQQVWEGRPLPEAGAPNVICSRSLLTEAQARRDATDAIAKTQREGFLPGTTVFLDVERVSQIPSALTVYVETWAETLLQDGRYTPGAYVHRLNADALFATLVRAYRASDRTDTPPMWVAGGTGFSLDRRPGDVGHAYASVWQGILDVERTWGGLTLAIDENVAAAPSPSWVVAPIPTLPPADVPGPERRPRTETQPWGWRP